MKAERDRECLMRNILKGRLQDSGDQLPITYMDRVVD
jgi:hypothetical protein